MKRILFLTVLSIFTLFAGDLKVTKVSKNIVVKEKQDEYKTFFEQYAHILETIIKDPYEKTIEYNTRLERLNDDNLTFSIIIDEINMEYIPDDSVLISKNPFSFNRIWGADYTEFTGCKDFYPTKVQIFNNKIYEVQSCRTHVNLEYNWAQNNTYSGKEGVKYKYDSSHTEYIGSNGYGATAEVTKYNDKYVFLVPEDPSFFKSVKTKRIDSNIEYAKSNKKMKLKIIGRILDPQKIQYGTDYSSATITDPIVIAESYIIAKTRIDKAFFIDSDGKEIEIDLN